MRMIKPWIPQALFIVLFGVGCTSQTKRLAPDELSEIEYGTGLTSQDFRSIAQRMARSLITLEQFQNATTPPTIAFVSVANESNDYIDGEAFLRKMRTELVKHSQGSMMFLDRSIDDVIKKENKDKSRGRRTSSGEEVPYGADFFLTGVIESIDKVTGPGRTSYMRYSFRLTNAANSAVVWEDDYEIKRHSTAGIMYR